MALTVIGTHIKRGYSGWDHLINDAALDDLIGETFRSARDVRRQVNKLQRENLHARVWGSPVAVEVRLTTGDRTTIMA